MAKGRGRDYFCNLVSENVEITLVNKREVGMKYKKNLFVRCNQTDCQYVELNEEPCPLTIELFADEIERREAMRRDR